MANLERMKKDDLIALAEANDVELTEDATKNEIIEELEAAGIDAPEEEEETTESRFPPEVADSEIAQTLAKEAQTDA